MDMIEQVSRALCAAIGMEPDRPIEVGLDPESEPQWRLFVDEARAAIEALREPSDAMINAGDAALPDGAAEVWRAMFGELLLG